MMDGINKRRPLYSLLQPQFIILSLQMLVAGGFDVIKLSLQNLVPVGQLLYIVCRTCLYIFPHEALGSESWDHARKTFVSLAEFLSAFSLVDSDKVPVQAFEHISAFSLMLCSIFSSADCIYSLLGSTRALCS